jgi:hypothetical protein
VVCVSSQPDSAGSDICRYCGWFIEHDGKSAQPSNGVSAAHEVLPRLWRAAAPVDVTGRTTSSRLSELYGRHQRGERTVTPVEDLLSSTQLQVNLTVQAGLRADQIDLSMRR